METSYYFRPVTSQPYALSTYSPDSYLSGETLVNNYLAAQPTRKHKQRDRKETVSVILPKVEYLTDSQNPDATNPYADQKSSSSTYFKSKSPPKDLKNSITIKKIDISTTRFSKSGSFRSLSSFKTTPCSQQSIRMNVDKSQNIKSQNKQMPARNRVIQRSNSCSKISHNNYLYRNSPENSSKSNMLKTRFSIVSALDASNRLIYTNSANNLHRSIRIPVRNMLVGSVKKLHNVIKVVRMEGEGLLRKVSSTESLPTMLANIQISSLSLLKPHRNSKNSNI
jgi:hypothetical protein